MIFWRRKRGEPEQPAMPERLRAALAYTQKHGVMCDLVLLLSDKRLSDQEARERALGIVANWLEAAS